MMNSYLIRVELNGTPPSQVYDALHAAMAAAFVYRTIQDTTTGLWYQLPNATYVAVSYGDVHQLRNQVMAITQQFWLDVDIIVANYAESAFYLKLAA